MASAADRSVSTIASRQHGLVSRAQATAAGMSAGMLRTRRRTGGWQEVAPGVFLLPGVPIRWTTKVLAACLAVDGWASHRTAAVLHDIDGFRSGRIEVTVGRGATRSNVRLPGVTLHRSIHPDLAGVRLVDGIPTTSPARLAVDLGSVVRFDRYERAVEDLISRNLLDWEQALRALLGHAARGRNGVGPLRALLLDRYGEAIPESALERAFLRLLRDTGVPVPDGQVEVSDARGFIARVDFAYPDLMIAIELDGVRWHLNKATFEADHRKRTRLQAAGWVVLAFTWSMVIEDPAGVLRAIRAAIAQRTA